MVLAVCLAGLAGYVDATGFLSAGGFFVSFMTGNSTRLGVALSEQNFGYAALAVGVIASFVAGATIGTLIANRYKANRRRAVLLTVAALLGIAALLPILGFPSAGIIAMTLAMGVENAVFLQEGKSSLGLTYMTGTLVKLGQQLAARISGDRTASSWPHALLWCGLVLGATSGAFAHAHIGTGSLWFGTLAALCLAAVPVRT